MYVFYDIKEMTVTNTKIKKANKDAWVGLIKRLFLILLFNTTDD